MTCQHIGNAIVCTGGQDYKILDANGKVWRFEMHPYCGPIVLTRQTGEVSEAQPPENSPFWDCVDLWLQRGRKFNALGTCDWTKTKVNYDNDTTT